MPANVKPVPEGFHTATPSLVVHDAAKAIEYYKKAFGAEERMQMPGPDGRIMHAEIKIGDSIIFLSDEIPGTGVSHRNPRVHTPGDFIFTCRTWTKSSNGQWMPAAKPWVV